MYETKVQHKREPRKAWNDGIKQKTKNMSILQKEIQEMTIDEKKWGEECKLKLILDAPHGRKT